jgi:hypothetical protein
MMSLPSLVGYGQNRVASTSCSARQSRVEEHRQLVIQRSAFRDINIRKGRRQDEGRPLQLAV